MGAEVSVPGPGSVWRPWWLLTQAGTLRSGRGHRLCADLCPCLWEETVSLPSWRLLLVTYTWCHQASPLESSPAFLCGKRYLTGLGIKLRALYTQASALPLGHTPHAHNFKTNNPRLAKHCTSRGSLLLWEDNLGTDP